MITAVVGRTFLNAYNHKYNKQLTPREFFVEEYFELFYNHPKYMQWITNSPFVQMKAGQKVHLLTTEERIKKLEELHTKIANETPDGSFVLGYPASSKKEFNSTSGLVSDIIIPISIDQIYLSWIGNSLAIGVGAYNILFDDSDILLNVFRGWKVYRKLLSDPTLSKLNGNQINSWNGQWVTYSFSEDFEENFDFTHLEDAKFFKLKEGILKIDTIKWSRLYFSLSREYPLKSLIGYVGTIADINKTVGFIPFQLKSATKLKIIYKALVGDKNSISTSDFETLFGMNFKRACELGSIGLQSLRPEGLVKYMNESKTLSFKNDADKINYYVFKTWLIAMISKNKEEVIEYTLKLAKTILGYRNSGTKNDRKTLVERLFESKVKRGFIESLTVMVKDLDPDDLVVIKNFKDEIHLMTNEEFGYFSTLLKFDYAFLENNLKPLKQ